MYSLHALGASNVGKQLYATANLRVCSFSVVRKQSADFPSYERAEGMRSRDFRDPRAAFPFETRPIQIMHTLTTINCSMKTF